MPLGRLAAQYTLTDNFFHAAFGGSFLNHMWLACACTPAWPDAPKARVAQLDPDGRLTKDGDLTPDGFVVNTAYTVNAPHPKTAAPADLMPSLTNPTIGDRLTAKGMDWAWYSGGWDDAIAGRPDPTFVFHHQPFAYFASYADGTDGRRQHLKDERDFMSALRDRTLPAVSFVKPIGADSAHPKYGDVRRGEDHVAALVKAVQESDYWKDTVIVLTYDENGGFWDHVAPPTIDRWGPGTRVPTIVVSPFAKKGYVDHTRYDTTSILRLIEIRWGLDPLGPRDAAADPLTGALGF
jgi:phospholipase C